VWLLWGARGGLMRALLLPCLSSARLCIFVVSFICEESSILFSLMHVVCMLSSY
jgi:hypothetical protein